MFRSFLSGATRAWLAFGLCASAAAFGQSAPPAPPPTPLTIDGDPVRGADVAVTCLGCHGIEGYRNAYPSYHVPRLGGQNADYIEVALLGYRRGSRDHGTMRGQAQSLSDQEIADVAAYFAALEGEPQQGKSGANAVQIEAGRRAATTCGSCHGEDGRAQAAQWPHLAGQHETYLIESMRQYRTGMRQDLIMAPLVRALDEQTLAALAAYFAAQPLLFTSHD